MIQVIYRWRVPEDRQKAFLAAWEKTTCAIREATEGAMGSFCVVGVEEPTEVLTIAKWQSLEQWQRFVEDAKLTSMKEMHDLGERVSAKAYVQKGDFTV